MLRMTRSTIEAAVVVKTSQPTAGSAQQIVPEVLTHEEFQYHPKMDVEGIRSHIPTKLLCLSPKNNMYS